MTKNRLTAVEAWLRVLGLSILAGIGFILLFHDLDASTPTLSMGWSLLARIAGAGILYLAYRAGKTLHKWGLLPRFEDELEDEEL